MRDVVEPTAPMGSHFDLIIDQMLVSFTGRSAVATAINGSIPGPLLRWPEGGTVAVSVTNRLKVPTSIHWHGISHRRFQEQTGLYGRWLSSRETRSRLSMIARVADVACTPRCGCHPVLISFERPCA